MAKINNTSAYAISNTVDGSDIVIGSENGNGGDTKNFQMSDIATYVMSVNTLTLQDVCDNGSATTTGITVAGTTTLNGTVDINNTADISGNTTIGGTLWVTGVSTLGEIDASGVADIADTLTLSKATGTGLQVDADVNIDGVLYTQEVRPQSPSTLSIKNSGGVVCATVDILGYFNIPNTGKFRILSSPPASAGAFGNIGEISVDADYIYVCTAPSTWKRVAIATW